MATVGTIDRCPDKCQGLHQWQEVQAVDASHKLCPVQGIQKNGAKLGKVMETLHAAEMNQTQWPCRPSMDIKAYTVYHI